MKALFRNFGRLLLVLLAVPATAAAIDPEDVREYGDVFIISGHAPDRGEIVVGWDIARDYFLYNNEFLSFTSGTPGVVLGEPRMPRGKVMYDELLGQEVEKYEGEIRVEIPVESIEADIDAMQLRVRSQGCLETVLCYPPTTQVVLIGFPEARSAQAPQPQTQAQPQPESDSEPEARSTASPTSGLLSGLVDDPLAGLARQDNAPALQPEEAFKYEAIGLSGETALVRFTVEPGYYLYRDQFAFRVLSPDGVRVREVSLPEGQIKDDPEFGMVPVYYDQAEVPVRFDRPAGAAQEVTLEADFQGCRDGDICYPPMTRAVTFDLDAWAGGASETADAAVAQQRAPPQGTAPPQTAPPATPVSEQDQLARVLTDSPGRAMFVFFLAGLLLAFTPCVFPMVPILSGIIAGEGAQLNTMRAFWLSLIYVLAMAVTYTVAGVLAGLFGQNLQAAFQNPWIISGFVAVFVLLALSMFGFYELQIPGSLQTRLAGASERRGGGRIAGVAVMGFFSALIVGPCVAPPLMAALIVIGASGDAVLGGAALFSLSLGMGVPLIVFGTSAGKILPKAGPWMKSIQAVFGVGLLALGIWLLERILPGGLIMVLWGVLAIACGIFLGALDRLPDDATGWRKLWKALGVILLLTGAMELVGAAAGGDRWTRPLESLGVAGNEAAAAHIEFRRVKSVDDLDRALKQAAASGKGAMLDFYADWCVECIRMERNTFPDANVQALLGELQPLQADVTPHDEVDQALMKRFGIIGPPAILFFDRSGEEMEAYRLIGYFKPEEFAGHLRAVLAAQ